MSSLKDKMYNYEVTPPSSVWDKIAIDLNEAELSNKFPNQLYNAQVTPPIYAWDNIAAELKQAGLTATFPERIYNAEITPPANAWEKISSSLHEKNETPVRPLYKRISPVVRYAAAAIVIGIIAFVVVKFSVGNNNGDNNSMQASNKAGDTSHSGKVNTVIAPPASPANAVDEDDKALEQSKTMVAKLNRPLKRSTQKLNEYSEENNVGYSDAAYRELSQSIYAYEDHVPSVAERYVMLMTPDGKIIRMSKKWGELLCCVSGEEQDAECQDQLKKWREKVANSSLAPSPANFMDILELVNSLEEGPEL